MAAVGGLQRVAVPAEARVPEVSRPARRSATALAVLLLVASTLFLAHGSAVITAPFGDSHDGRNAGVWATSARALRELGPIQSRMGTRSPEHGTYANHPPLIAVEVAAAETLGGGSVVATRAPAWIGSLVAIGLLGALLRERGLRAPAVGVGIVLAVATPMFLVFGTMLDTPVTSLPFGLGLLLLWERARRGRRVSRPIAAGLACLAVLAGWQSLLLAAVVGGWALVRMVRRRGSDDGAFLVGVLLGAALLSVWLWWAFGGTVRPLLGSYLFRSGQGAQRVPLAELGSRQAVDLRAMFGAVIVPALVGLLVALWRRPTRGLAAVALTVTVPYPLVFRAGAVNHEYWNYWFVLPLTVGLAVLGDRALRALRDRRRAEAVLIGGGLLMAGVMGAGAWVHPTAAGWAIREGTRAGDVAAHAELPADQGVAWYAGAIGRPASWLSLPTRRPAVHVGAQDLAAFAREHPGDLVLVGRMRCRAAGAPHIDYTLETPADLLARPPEVSPCPSG